MRAFNRLGKRGFTLVELMIVIAIIGVLAALAIYGVRRYLASAKTSEAKNTIGAIARGAKQSYERETAKSELLLAAGNAAAVNHAVCDDANTVPSTGVPKGVKYQPDTTDGKDFNTGDAVSGWKCLKFTMTQPIYYEYSYQKGTAPISGLTVGADGFEAGARGDLNGDGAIFSKFALAGAVTNNEMTVATQVFIENEYD